MSTAALSIAITPDDLLKMPDGKHFELVNGELVEKHVSVLSSMVEFRLSVLLGHFCLINNLGPLFSSTNGIRCFPDDPKKVRKPDVAFVKRERFSVEHMNEGFLSIAPDLAVEVVSINDSATEVDEKVEEYLTAGIPLIWVINPETKTVTIYRGDGTTSRLRSHDELSGETVIPGFRCRVEELFPLMEN